VNLTVLAVLLTASTFERAVHPSLSTSRRGYCRTYSYQVPVPVHPVVYNQVQEVSTWYCRSIVVSVWVFFNGRGGEGWEGWTVTGFFSKSTLLM
jgi:hypothetical protein